MAIRLPKSSGGRQGLIKNLKSKLEQLTDKMPYHYWIIAAGVVSLIFGAIVFFTLDKSTEKNKDVPPPIELVKVVAAKQDINPRAIIKDEMLKMVEVPEASVPAGAIRDMADIRNLPASVAIQNGDVITKKKVLSNARMAGFTGTIPPDCRAMSIAVTDVTGVAGFAKAGDYVDIMLVSTDREGYKITSSVVLQNVLLLGVNKAGSTAESDANGKKTNPPASKKDDKKDGKDNKNDENNTAGDIHATKDSMATATVAVTPPQSLQLAAAVPKGTLYLVLRPFKPRDNYTFKTEYTTFSDKKPNEPAAQTAEAPARTPESVQRNVPAPQPPVHQQAPAKAQEPAGTVEVIRGTEKTREGR